MKKIFVICIFFLLSCSGQKHSLQRQDLFSLSLGVFEDEIDVFDRSQQRLAYPLSFVMNQGFFYVSNASLGKIMKFSNNGDILSLLYTPSLNIPFQRIIEEGIREHNFNDLDRIEVDQNGYIYAIDKTFVEENSLQQVQNRRIIKVFDEKGNYLFFLGKNGISSQPFSYIHSLNLDNNNNLIVISREEESWFISYYNNKGQLLYNFEPLTAKNLSNQNNKEIYINDITVSSLDFIAYIHTNELNDSSNKTTIYYYHFNNKEILGYTHIDDLSATYPYSLLGTDAFGRLYVYSLDFTKNYYDILVYKSKNNFTELQKIEKINLLFSDKEITPLLSQIYLAKNGMISSMALYDRFVEFSWWRTDQLFTITS